MADQVRLSVANVERSFGCLLASLAGLGSLPGLAESYVLAVKDVEIEVIALRQEFLTTCDAGLSGVSGL